MFLLPSLALGLVFAALLGGRISRLVEVRLRASWLVAAALAIQVALFTHGGVPVSHRTQGMLHLVSYALLIAFALANMRQRSLLLLSTGMLLNVVVIAANGGRMPVEASAAASADVTNTIGTNITIIHGRLHYFGDVFALPRSLPLTNVFSVGDVLIALGMILFIVLVSLGDGERKLSVSRIAVPFRVRSYRRLATGRLISYAGDWLTTTTLIGWAYGRTGSTAAVAVLMLVRLAPPILGGGVAVVIVDRLPKERLIVWVELARGTAVCIALAGVVTHGTALVYVAVALSGGLAAIGRTAVPALVPSLLPPEQLTSANASLGVAEDVAMGLGAVLAGVALGWVGTAPALGADLVTFCIAAVLYSTIRIRATGAPSRRRSRTENGLAYLLHRIPLALLVASFAAATLATGLVSVTLPRLLDTNLRLGPSGYGFGFGALSLGLALGQGLVGFARVGDRAGRWIGLGLATMGGMFFLVGLSAHAPTVLLLLGAAGFVDGTTDVVFKTIVQREADPSYYGAVFGIAGASMRTTMIAGILAAPIANRLFAPRDVIITASVILLGSAVIALASARVRPARQLEQAVAAA